MSDGLSNRGISPAGDNGGKGGKASMNIDLADTENDVLLYGEEAERVWAIFKGLEAK
ncbi:MAG: hypothetical protein M3430_14640 [Acidobacteriota bacterium]|nr:hypothetical protein [Acidobacteriota bacterium]